MALVIVPKLFKWHTIFKLDGFRHVAIDDDFLASMDGYRTLWLFWIFWYMECETHKMTFVSSPDVYSQAKHHKEHMHAPSQTTAARTPLSLSPCWPLSRREMRRKQCPPNRQVSSTLRFGSFLGIHWGIFPGWVLGQMSTETYHQYHKHTVR